MSDDTSIARLTAALSDRYRIERELGAGGMATVYLAHDLRHDRKVALKVLRPELSAILGAERFLHEIKTTANLQHPHILSLFDSGEAGGFVFYVMPYVEGESLRDRLMREKQLPVEDAVRIAREVADALDYAHQHGVVHRDIKPENILLHGGHAMVADFGIALAASRSDGSSRMTETGMSLGTPHYMSPEQAMGEREITPRSDIYALGCVLYEMLTAEPPFVGATAQAIIARVLTEEPRSLTLQRKSIPPHVEAVVMHALEKLPADRFASAGEFAKALGDAGYHGTGFGPHGTVALRAAQRHSGGGNRVLVGALILFAGLAAWGWFRPARPAPVMRYGLAFAKGQEPNAMVALSRDGTKLAYNGPGDSAGGRIWIKEQSGYDATPVPGTDGAGLFTFSPDGRWIAFNRYGKIVKIPVTGGAVTNLADSAVGAGIAWLDDGTLIYTHRSGLMRVAANGGPRTMLRDADSTIPFRALPSPLPGARGVLFTACGAGGGCDPSDLWVMDLAKGSSKLLVRGALHGWYLPTGALIYVGQDGRLFGVPFDLKRLELRGAAVPVLNDVALLYGVLPNLTLSDGGTMVMQSGRSVGGRLGTYDLVSIDRAGGVRALDSTWEFRLTVAGGNIGLALSPDGSRVAIGINTNSGDDIWVKRLPNGTPSRLTFDSTAEARPRWTADGRYVSYLVNGESLWRSRSDGTGVPELVHTPPHVAEAIWSHDGAWLILRTGGQLSAIGARNIYGMRIRDTTVIPLAADPRFDERAAALSPDGRWLAYESDETGQTEVYVRPFPDVAGGKWQASANGGRAPLWSHSGRELYFVDLQRDMIARPVAPGPAFIPGDPVQLFHLAPEIYLNFGENYTPFDIAPDDRHFVMLRARIQAQQGEAAFLRIENWFPELQQQLKDAK